MIDSSVDFNCFNQHSFSSAVSQNLDGGSGDPAHDCTETIGSPRLAQLSRQTLVSAKEMK